MVNSWQQRRSEFNHEWLKPKYLNAVQSFIERLRATDLDSFGRLQEFIEMDFPAWRKHSADAWWLIQHFEDEMSPKILFNYQPLVNCDNEIKVWLAPLEHELWLTRCKVRARVKNAEELVRKVDDDFADLTANLPAFGPNYVAELKALLSQWQLFGEDCFALSKCLSEFPHRIEVL